MNSLKEVSIISPPPVNNVPPPVNYFMEGGELFDPSVELFTPLRELFDPSVNYDIPLRGNYLTPP